MSNLELWEKVREVPENAQKSITGGRLKGMTDINPMWRLRMLTEQFGPCGIGWRYTINNKYLEDGANGERAAFVDISLYYKVDDTWSEAIPGTGGASFVSNEKNGKYTSDECFKMALTDAISVACKALGVGADVYWSSGGSKYFERPDIANLDVPYVCSKCKKKITDGAYKFSVKNYGSPLCPDCQKKSDKL